MPLRRPRGRSHQRWPAAEGASLLIHGSQGIPLHPEGCHRSVSRADGSSGRFGVLPQVADELARDGFPVRSVSIESKRWRTVVPGDLVHSSRTGERRLPSSGRRSRSALAPSALPSRAPAPLLRDCRRAGGVCRRCCSRGARHRTAGRGASWRPVLDMEDGRWRPREEWLPAHSLEHIRPPAPESAGRAVFAFRPVRRTGRRLRITAACMCRSSRCTGCGTRRSSHSARSPEPT